MQLILIDPKAQLSPDGREKRSQIRGRNALGQTFMLMAAMSTCMCWNQPAQANLIINGDFENTVGWGAPGDVGAFPFGWGSISAGATRNAAAQQSGSIAIGGAGTSAFIPRTSQTRRLDQSFVELSRWQIEFDFAVEDAGDSNARSLSGSIYGNSGNVLITFRVNGEGDFQLFDNGGLGWHAPDGLTAAVKMSSDVEVTPLVHHLTMSGDFTSSPPNYKLHLVDSDGIAHETALLTDIWNSPAAGPALDAGITGISFVAGSAVVGDYLVDNVAIVVPEPTALLLGLLAFVGRLPRNRR